VRWLLVLLVVALPTSGIEIDDDIQEYSHVTCGSVVKLEHVSSGYRLHSHDVKWGSGSKQQSVTCQGNKDDANSLWTIKGGHNTICPQGTPIRNGWKVRLTHQQTGKNLHSHLHKSPLSQQQELSCYGSNGNGDAGDDWIVEIPEGDGFLRRGQRFRLKHASTNKWLHSHDNVRFNSNNCGGSCPIMGQQEATAFDWGDDHNNWWTTAEGFYFPVHRLE